LFFVDGSTDRIGIGTATPQVLLDVDNGGATSQILMCVNGCICAAGYLGEKQGHTIEDSGVAETQRTGLNFVVTDVGCVVDDSTNDATVVCINGANTCVPFVMCDGSTSDPIPLTGGSIGNQLSNDSNPTLGGLLCGGGNSICAVNCITITGCYFGDGSQLTGVSSVPSSFSGDCTIIGCDAGGNVAAGGAKIVLIGGNAGYNATTPSNIVVLGSSAALCMTTATDTVLIGTGSGRCVLTCAGNAALGAWSLYNECAGSFNTAVGTCAGLTQKGATTNTFVGAYAGTAVTTGSGNVFVGYKAGCASTASCCLIIGNGTCDLITGVFNTGIVSLVSCVGIGTTAPVAAFHLNNGASITNLPASTKAVFSNTSAADAITRVGIYAGGASAYAVLDLGRNDANCRSSLTYNTSADSLTIGTAGATSAAIITTAGCFGIGTTTPATLLHVQESTLSGFSPDSNTNLAVEENSTSMVEIAGTDSGILFSDASAWAGRLFYCHSNDYLYFATGQSNRMVLNSTGLGIGTTAPDVQLHVEAGTDTTTGTLPSARFERTGASQTGVVLRSNSIDGLILRADSAGFGAIHSYEDLGFYTGATPGSSYGTVRMRIDSSTGNIGIGTAAPGELLHLYSSAGLSIALQSAHANIANTFDITVSDPSGTTGTGGSGIAFSSDQCDRGLFFRQDGHVGIGTTAPTQKLDVYTADNGLPIMTMCNTAVCGRGFLVSAGCGCSDHYLMQMTNIAGGSIFKFTGDGKLGIGTATPLAKTRINSSCTSEQVFWPTQNNTSATTQVMQLGTDKSACDTYYLLYMFSSEGGSADSEFTFKSNGDAYADGTWNNSGADYQEYFESDSGSAAEVGRAVVLDNDKVRYYNSKVDSLDDIIGTTRPEADNKNSAVVGNTAWNHWTDKYLTDDWGVYLREDISQWTWTETDGTERGVYERDMLRRDPNWKPPAGAVESFHNVRKLNPNYVAPNPENAIGEPEDKGYLPRAERDEWWLIGLLGQVQIQAGEATNPRWIKMKNISDAVELWLIR